jgi:hypothetical protein
MTDIGLGHNQPPDDGPDYAAIDPTRLLVIAPDEIPALIAVQYPELAKRCDELTAGFDRWKAQHAAEKRFVIADEADSLRTVDFEQQIATFLEEVEDARKPVKQPIFEAGKRIDGVFASYREGLQASVQTMAEARKVYMIAEAARKRREREAAEAAAAEQARLAREEADRRRAEEDRLAREAASGRATQAQVEAAFAATDDAAERAQEAATKAEVIANLATAPDRDLVRARSGSGTTSSLRDNWTFDVTDIVALCRAVADGKVPAQFVMANDSVIRAAVRARHNPLRECPGLMIFNDMQATRRKA